MAARRGPDAPGRIRTCDFCLRRAALYPLSYGRLGFGELSVGPVRLAIISDTHLPRGNRSLPAACVAELRAADAILHAGDFMRLEVLEALQRLGPPVHGVHGNVDDEALRRMLPAARVVEAGGARIGMVHDTGPGKGRLALKGLRVKDG